MLVDSHCHLDKIVLNPEDNITNVLSRAKCAGVKAILCVGTNIDDYKNIYPLAEKYQGIYVSCGLHPLEINSKTTMLFQKIDKKTWDDALLIAVGETGLDYHYEKDDSLKKLQLDYFEQQLMVACDYNLPVIVHSRGAKKDTLDAIKRYTNCSVKGVMHCFTEDWEMAKMALDYGFYISFSGIVTFKKALELKEVAMKVPLDRLLIETDAPYLSPVPLRGKTNEPAHIKHTAEYIATLKNQSFESIAQQTSENFYTLFHRADKNYVLL